MSNRKHFAMVIFSFFFVIWLKGCIFLSIRQSIQHCSPERNLHKLRMAYQDALYRKSWGPDEEFSWLCCDILVFVGWIGSLITSGQHVTVHTCPCTCISSRTGVGGSTTTSCSNDWFLCNVHVRNTSGHFNIYTTKDVIKCIPDILSNWWSGGSFTLIFAYLTI